MSTFEIHYTNAGEEKERSSSSPSTNCRPAATNFNERLTELEVENTRLHRLVAELLIKNQELRKPD